MRMVSGTIQNRIDKGTSLTNTMAASVEDSYQPAKTRPLPTDDTDTKTADIVNFLFGAALKRV